MLNNFAEMSSQAHFYNEPGSQYTKKKKHGMTTCHDARLARSHEQNDYHQSQSFILNSGRALTDEEGSNEAHGPCWQ